MLLLLELESELIGHEGFLLADDHFELLLVQVLDVDELSSQSEEFLVLLCQVF